MITEKQLSFPSIYKKPIQIFSHMLYMLGNGVEFVDGNPVVNISYDRHIPYEQYYGIYKPFEECLEHYYRYYKDQDVEKYYDLIKGFNFSDKSEEELWKKAEKETSKDIESIQRLDISKVDDVSYWLSQIEDNVYLPLLHSSDKYSDITLLNENTEKSFLKYAIIITKSYIQFYESLDDKSILKYKNPVKPREDINNKPIKMFNEDLVFLKKELIRLENI